MCIKVYLDYWSRPFTLSTLKLQVTRTSWQHLCDGDFDCEWKYVDEDGNERTRQEYIACDDEIFHVREQINTNCTVHTVCGLDSYHFDSNIGRYRIQTSCRYFDNMSIVDGYNRFYPIGTRGKFYDPHKDTKNINCLSFKWDPTRG